MKGKHGYTLVEMVLYIALLMLITVFVVNSLMAMTSAWSRIKVEKNSNLSAMHAGEFLSREIHNALTVITASSQFDTNPGVLTLVTNIPGSTATTTTTFSVNNGQLVMKRGANATTSVIMRGVAVPYFVVNHFTNANSEAVRFTLQLTSTYRDVVRTRDFGGTAVLRGKYNN